MKKILTLYFMALFKPSEFALNRRLEELPSVAEFIWCSWAFVILQKFYAVGGILFGLGIVEKLEQNYGTSVLSTYVSLQEFNFKKWMILSILVSAILFPLTSWIYIKFWKMFTLFFGQLFDVDTCEHYDELVENSVAATLSSNILLLLPFVGPLLKKIAFIIIFFIHLHKRLMFSRYQSVAILLGPFILIGILMVLLGLTIGVYLNLV